MVKRYNPRVWSLCLFCMLTVMIVGSIPILENNEPQEGHPVERVVAQTPEKTTYHLGGNQYQTDFKLAAPSKAMGGGADPTVYKDIWGSGGDGYIWVDSGSPTNWDVSLSYVKVGNAQVPTTTEFELFLSFYIDTTFQSVKSLDTVDLWLKCSAKNFLEGDETFRMKEILTNSKVGYGGDPDYDSYSEVHGASRSSNYADVDASTFTVGSWTGIVITSFNWLQVGDTGYFSLYLEEVDFDPAEDIRFYSVDSGADPYLRVIYTLWSDPVANAEDITGEPSEMYPDLNYEVQTIISDPDGRTNLETGELWVARDDRVTARSIFSWDRATDTFSQTEGASYITLNTSWCASAEYGANGYQLTWNFTVLWGMLGDSSLDWRNWAKDAQAKYDMNWDNANTWFTKRFWLYSLSVLWTEYSIYLEDGDYVLVSNTLDVTGYVYWYATTTVYTGTAGTFKARLYVDGVGQNTTYQVDVSTSTGAFDMPDYTTPSTEDMDWSVDVQLMDLPTGSAEGPSNDNGKAPLFLVLELPTGFGATGAPLTLTIQPKDMVPARFNSISPTDFTAETQWMLALTDDGYYTGVYWLAGINIALNEVYFEFDGIGYPGAIKELQYEVTTYPSDANINNHVMWIARHSTGWENVFSVGTTKGASGTHALSNAYIWDGKVALQHKFLETEAETYQARYDVMRLEFNAISEEQVALRTLNGTLVYDVVLVEVLQDDVDVTIGSIPTTYSLVNVHNEGGLADGTTDDITGSGTFKLGRAAKGTYTVVFDTALTWHEIDVRPQLPDGLGENWDTFTWYMNSTRITENPQAFSHGNYSLKVYDAFEQEIYSEAVEIAATDAFSITYSPMLPMYRIAIKNDDREPYYLNITREEGGPIAQQPLPAMGEVHFRIYGLSTGANYSITVCKTADDSVVGIFYLVVPTHSVSALVDYVTEEVVDFEIAFPNPIREGEHATVSGLAYWTNSTLITGFDAYVDWGDGAGYENTTETGSSFYAAHQYTTVGLKTFAVRVVPNISEQGNVTKTYQLNVEASEFGDTPLLSGFIPSIGSVDDPISVFGNVRYPTGEWVSGENVTVYWESGGSPENASITAGMFSANHTYSSAGTYDISLKYVDGGTQWVNGSILIEADPTTPTKTFEVYAPSEVREDVAFTVVGYAYWSNGTVWSCGTIYASWAGEAYQAVATDGYFTANHTYADSGFYEMSFYPTGYTDLMRNITITVTTVAQETIQLTGFIPSIGSVNDWIRVFGSLRYSNGTSASGTVTIYWGDGEDSTPPVTDGRFSAPHMYSIAGTLGCGINYDTQWVNSTTLITADPITPTYRMEFFAPLYAEVNTKVVGQGFIYWSNGTAIDTSGEAIQLSWGQGQGDLLDTGELGDFKADHTYPAPGTFLIAVTYYDGAAYYQITREIVIFTPTAGERLAATIPASGIVNQDFTVFGNVFFSNGTAASGAVDVYWGTGEGSDSPSLANGQFTAAHNYTTTGAYDVAVNYDTQWVNGSIYIEEAYAGETPPDIQMESYWFDKDDATYIFITLTTNQGDCLVNVTENGTPKLTAQSETVRLAYAKATAVGYYNVTTEVYKTGYTTRTIFSSYSVVAETFYLRDFEYGVNDEFFFLLVDSSWNNASVDVWVIAVSPNGTLTKVINGVDENSLLQWQITNDERNARYTFVYAKISGTPITYEWRNFSYSYRIPEEQLVSNIQFPAYFQEFSALKQSMVGTNQLIMIGFAGMVLAFLFQSKMWGQEFFSRPMVPKPTRKRTRRRPT